MQSIALSPVQIVNSIQSTWEQLLLKERRPASKRAYTYASGFSPCTRQLTLEMVEGDKQPPWSAQQLANFERGDDREISLLAKLSRVGQLNDPPFKVIGQQERFELRDRQGRVVIVGKTDATFDFGGGLKPKIEVKNWSPNITARINEFEDLFHSPWTRRGAYQILAYLYGSGEPIGFLLLDRPGIPALIPAELEEHLDRMEDFLTRASEAQDHREAGTLPDYIQDTGECKRCWCYGIVCNPPVHNAGAKILTDPELEAMLKRRDELSEAAHEYDGLDKTVKALLRGVELGIAGQFLVEGKWGRNTTYPVPAEIKDKYKKVDEKGKFTLTFTRL